MFKYNSSLPIIENAEATMATIDFIFFFSLNSDIITALKNKDWDVVSAESSRMCQGGDCKLVAHDWICLTLVSYLAQRAFKLFFNCLLAFKQSVDGIKKLRFLVSLDNQRIWLQWPWLPDGHIGRSWSQTDSSESKFSSLLQPPSWATSSSHITLSL